MSKKKKTPPPCPETLGLPLVGVEAHAHLDMEHFDEDRLQVLERARAAGVAAMVNVFMGPEAYHAKVGLFADHPEVFFNLGVHPHEAKDLDDDTLAAMDAIFAVEPRLKALGEIGLDFFYDYSPREAQADAFRRQLALARERDLPVCVHSRDAEAETLALLDAEGWRGRPLLWHCFGGDEHLAREALSRGWTISIPGPVTYPKNEATRRAVAMIPLESMVLETDCPFLTPVPWRGKRNEPALMAFTAQAVAEIKGLDTAEVWRRTGETARRLFALGDLDPETMLE